MIQTTFGRFGTSVARPRNTPTNANNTRANSNPDRIVTIIELAEGERFELSLGLPLSLISSQVPSTTQPPFHTIMSSGRQRKQQQRAGVCCFDLNCRRETQKGFESFDR